MSTQHDFAFSLSLGNIEEHCRKIHNMQEFTNCKVKVKWCQKHVASFHGCLIGKFYLVFVKFAKTERGRKKNLHKDKWLLA